MTEAINQHKKLAMGEKIEQDNRDLLDEGSKNADTGRASHVNMHEHWPAGHRGGHEKLSVETYGHEKNK